MTIRPANLVVLFVIIATQAGATFKSVKGITGRGADLKVLYILQAGCHAVNSQATIVLYQGMALAWL